MNVTVDELDITNIEIGQPCQIFLFTSEARSYTGTVHWIAQTGSIEENYGINKFAVTIRLDDAIGLRVGMSARVEILTAEHTGVVLVPTQAIRSIDGKKYVLIADHIDGSGRTADSGRQVEIVTGLTNGYLTEITSGLSEGQSVIMPAEETGMERFFF